MKIKSSPVNLIHKIKIDNKVLLNWIGQAGFIFKINDTIICLDPYYSNSIERYEGRPSRRMWYNKFIMEEFNPDIVLCSHDHLDHTDPETIPLLNSYSEAEFYGPRSSIEHMENMKINKSRLNVLKEDVEYKFEDFSLKTTFSEHTKDSLGFIFSFNNLKVYFTGDTSLNKQLFKLVDEKIDIIISCVNGKYGNLNFQEAIKLAKKLKAKKIIPMHYGLVPDNTIDIDNFVDLCSENNLDLFIPEVEENYLINKNCDINSIPIS